MKWPSIALGLASLASTVSATTVAEINGNTFLSPLNGQAVTGVEGIVTAKGPFGFWLRSIHPDRDERTSESVYVFGKYALSNVTVGNVVSVDGKVMEYRSSKDYLYLTELDSPTNINILEASRKFEPVRLGAARAPPTQQYTSLDNGDTLGVPNEVSRVSEVNPVLQPKKYGLDFWESMTGELVTVKAPRAISKPNQYGDTWIVGPWYTTGNNFRGGLTITPNDANPEAIDVGDPLDGSTNPQSTRLGDTLEDITGILTYTFGAYTILPLTAMKVKRSMQPALPPPTYIRSFGSCFGISMGQYNVENLSPQSDTIDAIAEQIVKYLRTPDLLFIQEIQDDDGPTNDGVVDANNTLSALTDALHRANPNVKYEYTDIDPVNNKDGGQPGGNIRNAYLYNPQIIRLHKPNPGDSTTATEVLPGPELSLNPGRIDPSSPAWTRSRKPLAAAWETVHGGHKFFTVNAHWTAKLGGSSLHGDPRPPINGGLDHRDLQADNMGAFIAKILAEDPNAAVIAAGDFNEFSFVEPMERFANVSGLVDIDAAAHILPTERYTYVFQMNSQQLDHMYISPKLARRVPFFEHVHVSSWVSYADQISDHDPSVALLNVCN